MHETGPPGPGQEESAMSTALCQPLLERENRRYAGSGARSEENRGLGFRPAFLDTATGCIHPSRFRDGRPAGCHLLDGLPAEVVVARDPAGRVRQVKETIVSGFVRGGRFFTRDEAAAWIAGSAPRARRFQVSAPKAFSLA
jgi:hypothetical protein